MRLAPETRKQQILDAALIVAQERGYHAASRRIVAEAAGCAPALIQHHFSTMTQFKRALMRRAVASRCLPVIAQGLACRDSEALKAPDDVKRAALEGLTG